MKGTPGLPLAGPLDGKCQIESLIQITLSNPITGGLQFLREGGAVCMVACPSLHSRTGQISDREAGGLV